MVTSTNGSEGGPKSLHSELFEGPEAAQTLSQLFAIFTDRVSKAGGKPVAETAFQLKVASDEQKAELLDQLLVHLAPSGGQC